jgi:two-component system, response regulator / RNA-binding antiterminator
MQARVEGLEAVAEVFAAAAVRGPDVAEVEAGVPADAPRTMVVIGGRDSELAREAAERGLAPLLPAAGTLEEALALALRQLEELNRLRTMTVRLAQVERAKGILMERQKISERDAHEQLRRHARKLNLKLIDVAEAVTESYLLLAVEDV